jgi:Cu(I)/Ag(I) efflux system membrane fusion protein
MRIKRPLIAGATLLSFASFFLLSSCRSKATDQGSKMKGMSGHAEGQDKKILYYRNPMKPGLTSTVPTKDEMGMDYVPVYAGEDAAVVTIPGQAAVQIPRERQQLIGVQLGTVQKRPFVKILRTVGHVAFDPELYRAQEEYLAALSISEKMKGSSQPESVDRAKSLAESSELRLRLLGLSADQIQGMTERSGPDQSLLMSHGRGGTVWLYADVYENELPLVKVGEVVDAYPIADPDEMFPGRVKAIDTVINPKTRTARVRAELTNRDGLLKPDMYLNARIKIDRGERLTVPESAVMETGLRRIVFVAKGDGFFEPREVMLGEKSEDYYEVKSGLSEGDSVVTSANFLIDSESKLKAALSTMASGHSH